LPAPNPGTERQHFSHRMVFSGFLPKKKEIDMEVAENWWQELFDELYLQTDAYVVINHFALNLKLKSIGLMQRQ